MPFSLAYVFDTYIDSGLEHFFSMHLDDDEHTYLMDVVRRAALLALRMPSLFPLPITPLISQVEATVALSRAQCACIIANGFFSTFPKSRIFSSDGGEKGGLDDPALKDIMKVGKWPLVNFGTLYTRDTKPKEKNACSKPRAAKLRMILYYLDKMTKEGAEGDSSSSVSFHRVVLGSRKDDVHIDFTANEAFLGAVSLSKVTVDNSGKRMEDSGVNALQVVFGSKQVGGFVLVQGAEAEDVRFAVNTECIAARLIVQELGDDEALIITGSRQYSDYKGWSKSLSYSGPHEGSEEATIAVMDATLYQSSSARTLQYTEAHQLREVRKAYVTFRSSSLSVVATGHWGCEPCEFGHMQLKFILQWIAASIAGKAILYHTSKTEGELHNEIRLAVNSITSSGASVLDV
jgi:hypothetical protein